MTIISNTTPLCYLTLIGQIEILPKLYGNVHVTQKVLEELRHPAAPPPVRSWAMTPPRWLTLHSDPAEPDQSLADLDPGNEPRCFFASTFAPTWCWWMNLPLVQLLFIAV
jgi:hypothetical protein